MATPTDLRVEAVDDQSIIVRWTDDGGSNNDLFSSTDGITFTHLATIPLHVQIYLNIALLPATRYWYKISSDGGSTFSNQVTAVTMTCGQAIVNITQATQREDWSTQDLNLLADMVDQLTNKAYYDTNYGPGPTDKCTACINNGALVLDCSQCAAFTVDGNQDINSITLLNCGTCPPVDIHVPAGTTIGICGYPPQCNTSGDECREAKVRGPKVTNLTGISAPEKPVGFVQCKCPNGSDGLAQFFSDPLDHDKISLILCGPVGLSPAIYADFASTGILHACDMGGLPLEFGACKGDTTLYSWVTRWTKSPIGICDADQGTLIVSGTHNQFCTWVLPATPIDILCPPPELCHDLQLFCLDFLVHAVTADACDLVCP